MAQFVNQRDLFDFGRGELKQLKLYKALQDIGEDYVRDLKSVIEQKRKIASGDLLNSIDYEILPEVNDKLVLLLYAAAHLEYVAQGRRAGAKPPPYRKLIPWVKIKGINIQGKGEKVSAIIIAKSIAKKGIEPVPQIGKILGDIQSRLRSDELAKAARLDIEKVIGEYFAGAFLR